MEKAETLLVRDDIGRETFLKIMERFNSRQREINFELEALKNEEDISKLIKPVINLLMSLDRIFGFVDYDNRRL
ncbi:MAG: hypothetical protein K1X56_05700 [Flavobacteriales bacterium]|nr:hypothetical protein [Flavobacteriales bacterium]